MPGNIVMYQPAVRRKQVSLGERFPAQNIVTPGWLAGQSPGIPVDANMPPTVVQGVSCPSSPVPKLLGEQPHPPTQQPGLSLGAAPPLLCPISLSFSFWPPPHPPCQDGPGARPRPASP